MKNRIMAVVLACAVCLSVFALGVGSTVAQDNAVRVVFDGVEMDFSGDVAPFTENDRTLVPFRKIFEALGLTVSWDEATETAKGEKEGLVIELTIGNTIAKVNGEEIVLEVPAMLVGERTVVPLRFVSEKSGATVEWDEATRTATITPPAAEPTYDLYSEILPVKDGRDGIVTITMDDGYVKSDQFFAEQFEKNDLKGTIILIGDWYQKDPDAFQEMVAGGRMEIASHSQTHGLITDNMDDARTTSEIVGSQKFLRETFPGQQVICFAPPEHKMNETGEKLLRENYYAVRRGNRGYNSLTPTEDEWYNLKVQGAVNGEAEENMTTWLNGTAKQKKWLIEMWHGVEQFDPGTYKAMDQEISERHFELMGQLQKEGKLWCATFGEATKYLREAQEAKMLDNGEVEGRSIKLVDSLPNEYFDFPLSIKSFVPPTWSKAVVVQGDNKIDVEVQQSEDGDAYIIYDAVPDAGEISIIKGE